MNKTFACSTKSAHSMHKGLSNLERTCNYNGEEILAFATLIQLALDNADIDKVEEVIDSCLDAGLPVCLADIGLDNITSEELIKVAEKAGISAESISEAIGKADRIGCEYKKRFRQQEIDTR